MIAYIKGKIVICSPTSVVIETQGSFGIEVQITLNTFEKIKQMTDCQLFTYLHIKKDGQNFSGYELYGFDVVEDKNMFELLLSVSGIGANTARVMLSAMTSNDIKSSILTENERQISSIKGIGPKTAKRLILELKDKVMKNTDSSVLDLPLQNNFKEEALLALVTLGYQRNTVLKALNTIGQKNSEPLKVEEYIKQALKIL